MMMMNFSGNFTALFTGTIRGVAHPRPSPFPIFFGANTPITRFPYFVSVEIPWIDRVEGGGSIISRHFVVTAAHVFDYFPDKEFYQIRAGSDKKFEGGSVHSLDYYQIHPDYIEDGGVGGVDYDIALVRVQEPFRFDKTRRTIQMFDKFSPPLTDGTPAKVVGFGYTEKGPTNYLKATDIWVVDKKKCHGRWSSNGTLPVPKAAFCAGGGDSLETGRRDTCIGDSGGPLVINGTLAGVTSFGPMACGTPKVPAFYTEVSMFREWIDDHLKSEKE
ncbi:hypothetical protein QAD02_011737 [Eretmocerus hayati]|uniref:Uncharacterized protein n=1 Tax=Eretmocerus hayati TaxID=131215 RepID=A0ACC2NXS7_9HYME|nr:hypothetical protein QAD02_011737 [Eretmocerus hayati]